MGAQAPAPNFTPSIMMQGESVTAGARNQAQAAKLLEQYSSQPIESWTPDIFSPQGALTKSAQLAAVNAFKSNEAEKMSNPQAYQARQALYDAAAQDTSPDFWQKQMNNWAKTKGLQQYLGTGTQGGFAQSAFGDLATPVGQAFRAQNLAQAQGIIGQQSPVGINPTQAIGALQGADAAGYQQRQALRQGGYGMAQQNLQSSTDWINQVMGQGAQLTGNIEQAQQQVAAQNAAGTNALIGAGISAAGQVAGSALGSALGPH